MGSLAAALVAAQADMPAVEKNATNPHFGSRFISLDHLIAKTKPVLTKHGLAIVQFPATTDQGTPALTTTLIHAESGEQLSGTVPLVLAKQDMQGLGAALTYARRYGWASALAISDEDDDDGNAASAPAQSAGAFPNNLKVSDPVGGQKGAGAASSPAPAFTPPATASAAISEANGDWEWPSGKHQGKALKDTPMDYVIWYAENGPKADVKQKCSQFLTPAGSGASIGEFTGDDDIPFAPTIDGLGN